MERVWWVAMALGALIVVTGGALVIERALRRSSAPDRPSQGQRMPRRAPSRERGR